MKLSISLSKAKAKQPTQTPNTIRPSVFNAGDDSEIAEERSAPVSVAYNVEASKAMKKRIEIEKKVDSTLYEYDEVWDKIQEVKLMQKEAKNAETQERKPKYIHSLLSSAATRKLDHLRAEEKMMQRERELEGDEFNDKEAFVTQAYKDQMAEVRKAEEEERKREEMQQKQRGATSGMAHFYRQLLEDSEQQHEATVAATQKRVLGPQGPDPNLTIIKPLDFTPTSDLDLAKIARAQGKEVELNDDNQIVDKRELLAAGLNLSLPNTRNLALRNLKNRPSTEGEPDVQIHRAVGTAASRREINERRAREIQQQLRDEQERTLKQKQETEEEAVRRTVMKRNTEGDVQSARERYLQRKRQKLESGSTTDPTTPPSHIP